MPLHSRYPLRLLTDPVPAEALIDGTWTSCRVTAWAAKRDGWHAWCRLEDGKVRLVPAAQVRKADP